MHYFFAFDLGATSGRSILAGLSGNKIELEVLNRFPNKIVQVHTKYYWDIYALYGALKDGLKLAASRNITIEAIGIDTWGVDFVCLGQDGELLGQPRSYRDPYTAGVPEECFKVLSKKEIYELTGIQIMDFNTIFQLYAAKKENSSVLNAAADILFIPDALAYMLTGNKVCEYTIASTSQLLNPQTRNFDDRLFETIGVDRSLMQPIVQPGDTVGYLTDAVAKECGLGKIPVIAVTGHDTASAVVAVAAENRNFAYLSSGTWSLMGIEVEEPIITDQSFEMNFTNEGGIEGTTRFLKNITGMWLLEQCCKEWASAGKRYTYAEMVELAESVKGFQSLIDPDHPSFANPQSMTAAIVHFCRRTDQHIPVSDGEFVRCIFESLALKYRHVLECLQEMAPFSIDRLHVIGGGSQNNMLNQMTADSIGMPVAAGPSEATAIGNVVVQAMGVGIAGSLCQMRDIVRNSVSLKEFQPHDTWLWNDVYKRFTTYFNYSITQQKSVIA